MLSLITNSPNWLAINLVLIEMPTLCASVTAILVINL